ncbi:MAG: hypothetical protein AVO33_09900 [delta proteobacterium ML8_F1]|nr:MAG: hypothetical protein AVO33_09900 [delta proteobacterium ML8_F1]
MKKIDMDQLRNEIIGINEVFETPYGSRAITYADYTASGKPLKFIENYLLELQRFYANSHTEDDITGESMTKLLHESENIIKKEVNGEKNCSVIAAGTGSTGAMITFSKIIGLYMAPATKKRMLELAKETEYEAALTKFFGTEQLEKAPVVFIGPFEHHSNILIWRESIAEVVEIGLDSEGYMDLEELKARVSDSKYAGRVKIGSFSAGSNVTGVKLPVYEVARILHQNDALACFDFAASGPYVEIDMNKDEESYFDAVYISPHKFIGGPGSAGLLVVRNELYDMSLPPTSVGGGTVDYVSSFGQDYTRNIEEREKAGTPGIIQILKSAMAMQLKGQIGVDFITEVEEDFMAQFVERFKDNENVEILGPKDPTKRISIISFMIKYKDSYLHPRYITTLLNDLFGIQSRAGCSCAGPYGHGLLGIDQETSERFRALIQKGISSIKPGWVRVNLHYTMSQEIIDFLLDAIDFVSKNAHLFLKDYQVDLNGGGWSHLNPVEGNQMLDSFGVPESLKLMGRDLPMMEGIDWTAEYKKYLDEAAKMAEALSKDFKESFGSYKNEEAQAVNWFYFVNSING